MSKKLVLGVSLLVLLGLVGCASQSDYGYGGGVGYAGTYPYDDCFSGYGYSPYAYSAYGSYASYAGSYAYGPCGYSRTNGYVYSRPPVTINSRQGVSTIRRSAHPRAVVRPGEVPSWSGGTTGSGAAGSSASSAIVSRAPVMVSAPSAPAPAPSTHTVAPRQ